MMAMPRSNWPELHLAADHVAACAVASGQRSTGYSATSSVSEARPGHLDRSGPPGPQRRSRAATLPAVGRLKTAARPATGCDGEMKAAQDISEVKISSLSMDQRDGMVRLLMRRALQDAWPAVLRFGWHVDFLCELAPDDGDVGYTDEDGTVYVKLRNPASKRGQLYAYSFILSTLLHELTHLSFLGHGRSFYRRLEAAVAECNLKASLRREVRAHICGELLNAICDNDTRRARALLSVMPEAVTCPLPGHQQLPLDYAAHHGRVALTRLLLEARADATAGHEPGATPLDRAAAMGNQKTARMLLEADERRLLTSSSAPGGISSLRPRQKRQGCAVMLSGSLNL